MIDNLEYLREKSHTSNGSVGVSCAMMAQIAAELATLRSQTTEPWIPVSERLPDNNIRNVLCYWNDRTVETFCSCCVEEWNTGHDTGNQITHWTELPEPPRKDGAD